MKTIFSVNEAGYTESVSVFSSENEAEARDFFNKKKEYLSAFEPADISEWGDSYCYGGLALIYDEDIAKALCTPSELKRTNSGRNDPNPRETWMDVQARAYFQAYRRLINCA